MHINSSLCALGMSTTDFQVPVSVSIESLSSSPSPSPGSSSHTNGVAGISSGCRKRKAGRRKFKETRHPVYQGVRQRNGRWVCELRQPRARSRIWLGTFDCPDMAARAYDAAALVVKGESTSLNFPESATKLPRAASSSVKDIQSAALEAAHTVLETTGREKKEEKERDSEGCRRLFVDEEALFNMPTLLDSMAEGLILTPPALVKGFNWNGNIKDVEEYFTLWTD